MKTSAEGSDFIFDCFHLLYYKCQKIDSKSYIASPDWLKNKKAAINLINKKGNKCLQYAVTVAINQEEITKRPKKDNKN